MRTAKIFFLTLLWQLLWQVLERVFCIAFELFLIGNLDVPPPIQQRPVRNTVVLGTVFKLLIQLPIGQLALHMVL